jgi:hypothetical protein
MTSPDAPFSSDFRNKTRAEDGDNKNNKDNDSNAGKIRRNEKKIPTNSNDTTTKTISSTASIVELLDELLSHMNIIKNIFTLLILSSFILAPISLIVAGILILHPLFLYRILFRLPTVGSILLVFISISIMLASIWLFIGISEHRFFSQWNKRFSKYMSKKKQIDEELESG